MLSALIHFISMCFYTNLLSLGMGNEIIPMVGDGHCFFRSISFNLYSHQNNGEIRLQVVEKIANDEWYANNKDSIVCDEFDSIPVTDIQHYKLYFLEMVMSMLDRWN